MLGLKTLLKLLALGCLLSAILLFAVTAYLYLSTPEVNHLASGNLTTSSYMEKYCSTPPCNSEWVSLDDMPNLLKQAAIKIEDPTFYFHHGVVYGSVKDAIILNFKTRSFAKGASSISMQLARNLFLSADKNVWRKLKEIFIATKLEQALSKDRILELYLNTIEFGPNQFGIANGAKYHFSKLPSDLSFANIVSLLSILPSPRHREPLSQVAGDETRRRAIADELIRHFQPPATQQAIADTNDCPDSLDADARAMVDSILSVWFSRYGTQILQGDAARISYAEFMQQLTEPQRTFLATTFDGVKRKDGLLVCNDNASVPAQFTAIRVNIRLGFVNYWLANDVAVDWQRMHSLAQQQGITLSVESGYRSPGYQAYLALRMLKRVNYCPATAFEIVEKPFNSEHGCYSSHAVDIATPNFSSRYFDDSPAYLWLNENAEKFGFSLTYPPENDLGIIFEPWHWRHARLVAQH